MRTGTLPLTALAATLTATIALPALAAPSAAPQAKPVVAMDFTDVDFEAAAQAEGMAIPTHDFHISTRFGEAGSHWSSGYHTGLDFAAPTGTNVEAAEDGKVITAGPGGAYGNLVEIHHGDGTTTRYAHLSDIDVRVGQRVGRDQHIGDVGSTGNSTGPHLHFEVLKGKKHLNPERFVHV